MMGALHGGAAWCMIGVLCGRQYASVGNGVCNVDVGWMDRGIGCLHRHGPQGLVSWDEHIRHHQRRGRHKSVPQPRDHPTSRSIFSTRPLKYSIFRRIEDRLLYTHVLKNEAIPRIYCL